MRGGLIAIACVVACGGEPTPVDHNAVIDAAAPDAPACIVPTPLCTTTCGNNQLEACWWESQHGCNYSMRTEDCDGELGPTCADRDFYGDVKACDLCRLSVRSCEACNPVDLACAELGFFRFGELSASGSLVGIIEEDNGVGANPDVWVVDHVTKIASYWHTSARAHGIVGVQNGWLVAATGPAIFTLDADGNAGPAQPIDTDEPAMAAGPGGGVIISWLELTQASHMAFFELVNANGQIIVPKTPLFEGDSRPGVAANGTHFLVGTRGSLARVSSTGTASITTGFPTFPAQVHVAWSATTGWYVTRDNTGAYVAQRFDATGTPIGSLISIGTGEDFLADGNDLLVLRYIGNKLHVVRLDPNGAQLASTEVGAGLGPARLVRTTAGIYVAWAWLSKLRVAQVAL